MADLSKLVKPLVWSWDERAGLFEAENPVTFITMCAATEEDCEDSNARYTARILAAIDTDAVGAALAACQTIDDAVKEGHESMSELVLHLLSATDDARAALRQIGGEA